MKKILFSLAGIAFLFSCTVTTKSKTADTDYVSKYGIVAEPMLAEVEIKNERVNGTYTLKTADHNANKAYGKNMAVANAIEKSDADYLVQPTFEIISGSFDTQIKVEGYPGFYKNFRPMTLADTAVIRLGYGIPVDAQAAPTEVENENAQAKQQSNNTKKQLAIIAGGGALLLLVLLIL
jgi:hypothetical protein